MKIMITGGGSGGHIAPALAVADEIKKLLPNCQIHYVIGRQDNLKEVVRSNPSIDKLSSIFSGKFRRYHGEGLKQLLDAPTILKNLRDLIYIFLGFVQSIAIFITDKPDVLFAKGGFVGAPVGLVAAIFRVPYVTHDSDAIPGLSNRLISKWATAHAVALPKEAYNYPTNKTFQVGTPINNKFDQVDNQQQVTFKESFGLTQDEQVLFVTGGGNGASRINLKVAKISQKLLSDNQNLVILHISGKGKEAELTEVYQSKLNDEQLNRVVVEPFANDLYRYSGAADIIVTRAGANSLAEFAAQGKACIIIPNQHLTGGHQLKNAKLLADKNAAIVLQDQDVQNDPDILISAIENLLSDPKLRQQIGQKLNLTSQSDSAKKLAQLIISVIKNKT